jgi:hypothetical protein
MKTTTSRAIAVSLMAMTRTWPMTQLVTGLPQYACGAEIQRYTLYMILVITILNLDFGAIGPFSI